MYSKGARMIDRYSRQEMSKVWSEEFRFQTYLDIELHACDAMAKFNIIPEQSAKNIRNKAGFDIERIKEIESETRHETIAFLTNLAEYVGEDSRFIHKGLTSSDILDTGFAIQLMKSADILIKDIELLLAALKNRATEHKFTPCVARTHGVHAEPTTLGLKLANCYAEFTRALARLVYAREEIASCALSGAVGNYAHIDPRVEEYVAKQFGLRPETISTQVIPRDRHAVYFSILGVIACSIERIATEIRNLQRTEIREVSEFFHKGQKGSSAMPHKQNPILSENLTGLARIVKNHTSLAFDNVSLWHERDMSHSSIERTSAQDAVIVLDFALNRLTNIIENLIIYPDNMKQNLNMFGGIIYSQPILLALVEKGLTREQAYSLVQSAAIEVVDNNGNFINHIKNDKKIMSLLTNNDIDDIVNDKNYIKNVDIIFDRVFK